MRKDKCEVCEEKEAEIEGYEVPLNVYELQCVDKSTKCTNSYKQSLLFIIWLYMFRTITSPSPGASSDKPYNSLVCSCYQASLTAALVGAS